MVKAKRVRVTYILNGGKECIDGHAWYGDGCDYPYEIATIDGTFVLKEDGKYHWIVWPEICLDTIEYLDNKTRKNK